MTDPSPGRKGKIKIAASSEGVKIAERALIRLGFDSKSNFAQSKRIARNTVTKFFHSQLIQVDTFKEICKELKLNWLKIAAGIEEEQSEQMARNDCSSSDTNEGVEQVQKHRRRVTVIEQETKKIKSELILQGDINSVHNFKIIWLVLQEHSGDTIEIVDIKEGSIRLIVEGSQKDIERLVSRIRSGELKNVSGFPIEDIQIVSESSDYDESTELDDKWRLVKEIVSQAVEGRSLSDADLSDADLSGANLSRADLSEANLSDADLSGANLRGANLSGADLSGANLSRAQIDDATKLDDKWRLVWEIVNQGTKGQDLSGANLYGASLYGADLSGASLYGADLSGADLSGADLSGANLSGAHLRGANLTGAVLSEANLSGAYLSEAYLIVAVLSRADLSGAYLSRADLSGADLSDADLSGANLSGANVKNALFGRNLGISEDIKFDLKQRGAIFEDSPGERSPVMTPH